MFISKVYIDLLICIFTAYFLFYILGHLQTVKVVCILNESIHKELLNVKDVVVLCKEYWPERKEMCMLILTPITNHLDQKMHLTSFLQNEGATILF